MPRSNPWLLICVVAVGCKASDRELVYVNATEVSRDIAITSVPPKAGPSFPATTASIPALPQRSISIGDTKARLQRAKQVIAENRKAAQVQIARELQESYTRDINRDFREKRDALSQGKDEGFKVASEQLRDRFLAYATKRAPFVARLALLADFPDRDPNSKRVSDPKARIEAEAIEEAKQLRLTIAALDSQYRSETDAFLAQVGKVHLDALSQLQAEMQRLRVEAEERAQLAARRQLQDEVEIRSILEKKPIANHPAEPGKSVTVPGSAGLPNVKPTTHQQVPQALTLQDEIEIWAATHNYTLSKNKGRDATQEFLKWRQQRTPGL